MQELVFDVFFVTALVRHVYTDLQEFLLYDSINISLAVMGLLHAWYEHNFWAAGAGLAVFYLLCCYCILLVAAVWGRVILSLPEY